MEKTNYVKALARAWSHCKKNNIADAHKRSSLLLDYVVREVHECLSSADKADCKIIKNAVESDGTKRPGEWLLDAVLAKKTQIVDDEVPKSRTEINASLVWAIECEYHSGMPAFARDFSKLLFTKSRNHLYLNGIQRKADYESYMARRTRTVKEILDSKSPYDHAVQNMYFGFWLVPGTWDEFDSEHEYLNACQRLVFEKIRVEN